MAMSKLDVLLANEQDPTDFPAENIFPGLRKLDAALRCPICRAPFDAPITLVCGHCFCSLCVRDHMKHMDKDPLCPTCRKPTNEQHIRANPVIEEAVSAWKEARASVLQLAKAGENGRPPISSRENSNHASKKRRLKIESDDNSDIVVCPAGPSSNEATSSSPVKAKSNSGVGSNTENGDERVQCPVCQQIVKHSSINAHLDNRCQSPPAADESRAGAADKWSKILNGSATTQGKGKGKEKETEKDESPDAGQDPDPLPKVSYDILKDKNLRDLLQQQGLSVKGDRKAMSARHQRWLSLYNSNLDKSKANRKSDKELKEELKKWEESSLKGKKIEVENTVAYEKRNSEEFARLTKKARETLKRKPPSIVQSKGTKGSQEKDAIVVDSEGEP